MTRTKSERVYDLLRCVRPLTLNSARVVEQQLREHDLTVGTRAVLEILCGTGPLTVPALAGVLETSRQAAQRLVDERKGRGYVEQRTNPQHRRSVLIAVTESGREAFERVHAEELRQLSHMLRGVPTEDLDVAVRVLRRLSDDVRRKAGR